MPTPDEIAQADGALTKVMTNLLPYERAMVQQTEFVIQDHPSADDRADFPDDGWLLGLYSSPPPQITVYAGEIAEAQAAGKPASIPDVVRHEVGHALGYSHDAPGAESAGQQGMRMRCGIVPNGHPHSPG